MLKEARAMRGFEAYLPKDLLGKESGGKAILM